MSQLLSDELKWDAVQKMQAEWPQDAWIIAEYPNRLAFEKVVQHQLSAELLQLRVFNPEGELRLRKIGADYRAVFLGSWAQAPTLAQNCDQELAALSPSDTWVYLWGERTDQENEWIEGNIPRYLNYPIAAQEARSRVKLQIEYWQDPSGQALFHRFKNLQEVNDHA